MASVCVVQSAVMNLVASLRACLASLGRACTTGDSPLSIPFIKTNGKRPYIDTYICFSFVVVLIYIYNYFFFVYILGSSARFARAEAYGIISWDYITELYFGIIIRDNIPG